jgi:hypothetical protein
MSTLVGAVAGSEAAHIRSESSSDLPLLLELVA